MKLQIIPQPLSGEVVAVASKSDVHRALICAALADGETVLTVSATNRDILATVGCLRAMGARIEPVDEFRWRVTPIQGKTDGMTLDFGESGSTLRFLLPLVSALGISCTAVGSGRLPERPLSPLREELITHGAVIVGKTLPLTLSGTLRAGVYSLPGDVSSQYITGLLFSLPLLIGESEIVLTTPLESAGYVTMTLHTLAQFGITVQKTDTGWRIPGAQRYHSPGNLTCEGDWSNAAFYLVAGALSQTGPVTVAGLNHDSAQGDRAIVPLLQAFGATVQAHGDGRFTVFRREMRGISIDAAEIPDLVPILAVCACAATGETRIQNAARLRLKESDRLQSVAAAVRALGGEIEELPDGLVIFGKALSGGVVDCQNDHRIAMSMAVAALLCRDPVLLDGAEAVEKSYPRFFADYQSIGGNYHVL